MSRKLKEQPQKILDFIRKHVEEMGYPPTVREIGEAVGISSTSHVTYYLKQLEEQGYIAREDRVSRGIRLLETEQEAVEERRDVLSVPYLGYIGASQPIAYEPLAGDETVELSQALFGGDVSDLFALTVQGNSMIDALINDGDLIILRAQEEVNNGEMAAVWIEDPGETTLKKYYREGTRVRLQPANPTMDPIYVPANNVHVQGKVIMVIRELE